METALTCPSCGSANIRPLPNQEPRAHVINTPYHCGTCNRTFESGPLRLPQLARVADITAISIVVNGHRHTVDVPASDQQYPVDRIYTTSTSRAHTHQVTLTARQLATLASGGDVTVTSTVSTVVGTHAHDLTFHGAT